MPLNKYLYCPKGKHYPAGILEVYDYAQQARLWDGDDYQEVGTKRLGDSTLLCAEHECTLEEKEEPNESGIPSIDKQELPAGPGTTSEEKRDSEVSEGERVQEVKEDESQSAEGTVAQSGD